MKSIFFDPTGRSSDGQGQLCLRDADRAKPGIWPLMILALVAGSGAIASAQTRIDLRTQAKSVDFSAAGSTKPSKMGTTMPTACSVGETFLKTDATAGQNFYVCTATNVWTLQGSVIPSVTGMANMVLATDGTALVWKALGGDASGAPSALTVAKIQGRLVSGTAPASGQALAWNSTTMQWEPQMLNFGQIGGTIGDLQVGTGINAAKIGGGGVSNTVFGYLANLTSDLQTQLNGKSASGHTHTVSGDASGSLGTLTVTGLQGRAIAVTAPVNGQSLVWNSALSQWQPTNQNGGVAAVFGRSGLVTAQTGDYTFSQISGTVTDAQISTGINAAKLGTGTVTNTTLGYLANVTADVQSQFSGKASLNQALVGDAGGTLGATTVVALRNRAVAAAAPSNGQALVWNSATSQWEPQSQSGGVPLVFGRSGAVTAQTGDYSFGQILGTVADAQVATGINATKIGAGTVSNATLGYLANVSSDAQAQLNGKAAVNHTHTAAGDVAGSLGTTIVTGLQNRALSSAAPSNGQTLVWNSALSLWQPQNQSTGVSSVYGRTGAVTGQTGDYSFAQISGTVTDSQVSTGINANKIGAGSVGNSAFGYLANATSDIQTQLNGKASIAQALVGDLSGTLGSSTVAAIQNRSVSATAPSDGQALVWKASAGQWQPQNQGGGVSSIFGRMGAITGQSGDYSFGQISGTVTDTQVATGINATKIGGGAVSNTAFGYLASATGDLQVQLNGKSATGHSHAVSGDVSGASLAATTVTGLQSRAVASTTPTNGQALVWNSGTSQWQPQAVAGGISMVFGRTGPISAQSGDYTFSQVSGTVTDSQVSVGISANKIGGGTVANTAFGYLANVASDIQTQLNSKTGTGYSLTGDLSGTLASTTVSGLQTRPVSTSVPANGQVLTWNGPISRWEPQNPLGTGSYSASFAGQTTVTIPGVTHQLGTGNLLVSCYDTTATPNMRVQTNSVSVNPANYDVIVTFVMAQTGRCVVSAGGGAGSGVATMASQLGDLSVSWTSAAVLTVGPSCSVSIPCNVRIGSNVVRFINPSTIMLTGGTGVAYLYVDVNGVLTVGHNLSLTCTAPCNAVSGVASFPLNSLPLFSWSASGGSWDMTGGIDKRAIFSSKVLSAGIGIVTLENGSSTNISVDAAVVPQYLTATATLSFGAIATGSCGSNQTFALTGAAIGDSVAPGWPSSFAAGLLGNMWVSAPNTVSVRMCNLSGATLTPASTTYRGTVVKSF